jgi:hypothetical protein
LPARLRARPFARLGDRVAEDPHSEIEIRQVFEADDFGAELTPELGVAEQRQRDQIAKKN